LKNGKEDFFFVDESNFTDLVLNEDQGVLVYFTNGLEWDEVVNVDANNKIKREIRNVEMKTFKTLAAEWKGAVKFAAYHLDLKKGADYQAQIRMKYKLSAG
jgi:hypothetical protein